VLWTRLAGGNDALALLITVATTGLGWLTTTLWLTLGTGVEAGPDAREMMRALALVLVVPVALGQGVRLLPGVAEAVTRHHVVNGVVVRLIVALVVLRGVVEATVHLEQLTVGALLATGALGLTVHLAGVGLGLGGGRVLGFARGDCIAIAFGGSQKTLPVGLFLVGTYYGAEHPLAVVPMLLYHVGQLVVDTFIADALVGRAVVERAGVGP
jgi:sodium/bile acid cotransporter 7